MSGAGQGGKAAAAAGKGAGGGGGKVLSKSYFRTNLSKVLQVTSRTGDVEGSLDVLKYMGAMGVRKRRSFVGVQNRWVTSSLAQIYPLCFMGGKPAGNTCRF